MNRKLFLYFIIAFSFVPMITAPIIYIITSNFFEAKDIYWVLGSFCALLGFVLLNWQFILGIKPLSAIFTMDVVATNKLHKWFGMYGLLLIFMHPILVGIEYLTNRGTNILTTLSFETPTDVRIAFGKAAITIIVTTWLTSYVARKYFSFRTWKRLHLFNFFIIPILFFHAKDLGTFLNSTALIYYFYALQILYVFIVIYKIAEQLGFLRYKFEVTNVSRITHDIVKIDMKPTGIPILPSPGQFIQIQLKPFGETHPFTISHYNPDTKEISISTKSSGYFSSKLVNLTAGQKVFISGPFGVFTKEAYYKRTRKVVMIAGGIGITPFIRMVDAIDRNPQMYDEAILLFGNKTREDLAFNDYINSVAAKSNLKFINVLSGEKVKQEGFENGFITSDLIKKYLKEDLPNYKFFICGPPIMMTKMEADLISKGVKRENIMWENFSF
ncbi:MAG: ferric reductase-like transmembrane domain-containing protein [Candidatus Dojkabacteria bacterium]